MSGIWDLRFKKAQEKQNKTNIAMDTITPENKTKRITNK